MTSTNVPYIIDPSAGMPTRIQLGLGAGGFVSIDASSGEIETSRRLPDPTRRVAARLAVLSWVRALMPVPTPPELWSLEAAALASRTHSASLITSTLAALPDALEALTDPAWDLPVELRAEVGDLGPRTGVRQWEAVLNGIRVVLRGRTPSPPPTMREQTPAAPPHRRSWFTVEWDRVQSHHVDPRELVGCATVGPDRWTVQIPAAVPGQPVGGGELVARLIDTDSQSVADTAVMGWANGIYQVVGEVPSDVPARWRVEVTEKLDLAPRELGDLLAQQFEQAVFRGLMVARFAAVYPSLERWRDTVWDRAHRQLRLYETVTARSDLALPPGPPRNAGLPFLAEEWMDPTRIVR